jgi:hypothetical protein
VSDGNAAHNSKAAMMKMMKAMGLVFPKAQNFAAVK